MNDGTSVGGPNESFETTYWGDLLKARTQDEGRRTAVLNELLQRYWKPVYCYLRRKGLNNEDAKDLTQGFFHEIVLGRRLIEQADPSKGRFRTFLLTALDRYVTSMHRAATARKRMPQAGIVHIEDFDSGVYMEATREAAPDDAFNYAWAVELLNGALSELESECTSDGMLTHWRVFQARVLRPTLENTVAPPLSVVCAECGISDETKASNMIITAKRRFQALLRRRVRLLVGGKESIDEEIRDLMRIFSGPRAG